MQLPLSLVFRLREDTRRSCNRYSRHVSLRHSSRIVPTCAYFADAEKCSCDDSGPKAAYNWWFFSFHAFTGAVIQATVLLYSPGSIMKDDVRSSFESSIRIFTTMAPSSIFASRALPILLGLRSKIETGCEANFMTDSARSSVFNHTNATLDYNSQLTDVMWVEFSLMGAYCAKIFCTGAVHSNQNISGWERLTLVVSWETFSI
jgi:hypothetical protein